MLALGSYVVLTLLLQAGICASSKMPNVSCNHEGDFKLLNPRDVNGYIDGVALLCETGTWRTIHDSNLTVADRTVACRQLGYTYSGVNAVAHIEFSSSVYQPSTRIMECTGSESTLLECLVINTTANTNYTIVDYIPAIYYVNCTTRVLHPRPLSPVPIPSQSFGSSTETSKPSSPVPKPLQTSSSTTEISLIEETGGKCTCTHDDNMAVYVSFAVGATILVLVCVVLLTAVLILRNRWKAASGAISAREDEDATAIVLERNEAYMTSMQAARNEAYGVSPLVGSIVSITEADYVSIHSTPEAPNTENPTDPTY